MARTAFFVDGFNLYHSQLEASRKLRGARTRWLDVAGLCQSYLGYLGRDASLQTIVYFTAIPYWRDQKEPGASARHVRYLDVLQETGVAVRLGRFAARQSYCPHCGLTSVRHEEKETDVGIAAECVAMVAAGEIDNVVLVSGDSDLSPVLRQVHLLRNDVLTACIFPFGRVGFELASVARFTFRVRAHRYLQHRLPERIALPGGRILRPPEGW